MLIIIKVLSRLGLREYSTIELFLFIYFFLFFLQLSKDYYLDLFSTILNLLWIVGSAQRDELKYMIITCIKFNLRDILAYQQIGQEY